MTKLDGEKSKLVRRQVYARVPHGVKPELAITVYWDGRIGLREAGRPAWTEQIVEAGQLYTNAMLSSARRAQARTKELVKDGMRLKLARRKARRENGLGL